jgi:hypothetical protein
MTEQPIPKKTSFSFEAERARVVAAMRAPAAFQAQVARSIAGITSHSEMMQRQLALSDPLRDFRESLTKTWGVDFGTQVKRLSEETLGENFRRQMKALVSNFGSVGSPEDARASFMKSAAGINTEQLLGGWTPQKFLQELAGQSLHKQFAEQAARWRTPHEDLARSLRQFHEPLDWSSARQLLETFAHAPSVTGLGKRLEDGEDAVEDPAAREQEDEAVQELVAKIETQPTLQEAVSQMLLAIERNKQPALQVFLVGILLPVLLAVCSVLSAPYVDFHVKRALETSSKREDNKTVKEAAREALHDLRLLQDFRFVGAKCLQVMATARARGPVIGNLQFGQVVRVVEKERDFTLIAWKSEDGKAELQGWVFSRYLERFR